MLVALLLLTSCAHSSPQSTPTGQTRPAPTPTRILAIEVRAEPAAITRKALSSGIGTSFATTQRLFNAYLGVFDGQGNPQPYLAETLPELNTPSWQAFPDGRMETTHRLKPGLTWHDGTPLTMADFVFAWQVYTSPQVGIGSAAPQSSMADVSAPDARTLVIQWRQPFPNAAVLTEDEFPALPRHLLEDSLRQDPDGFATQPFFTRDYVGLGPYRVSRWEPGAFIEGTAFDGHTLGRPKIDGVRVMFVGDTNTALANLLADNVQFASDSSIRFEQAVTLQREWGPRRGGAVVIRPESFRGAWFQLRPQFASPAALLDIRVRRALAHTVDRDALNEGLFEGQGIMTEAPFITPTMSYFPEVDRAISKYPHDPRAADQLLSGAGYRRGNDGFWAGNDGRLQLEIKTLAATEREKEMAILADGWRQTGFEVSETVLPASQAADNQSRATYSSIFTYSTSEGDYALAAINSSTIGTAENRWIGTNRAGWVNPEFDRLSVAFKAAVAPEERVRNVVGMSKIFTDDLPAIPLLFDQRVYAHTAALTGPKAVAQEALIAWDVHLWELK